MNVQLGRPAIVSRNPYRFGTFVVVMVVALSTLTARMAQIQLAPGQSTYTVSQSEAAAQVTVPASRGMIFDDKNHILAQNIPNFVVQIVPRDLKLEDKETVVLRLSSLLQMDPLAIVSELDGATGSQYEPVDIATGVSADLARVIDENRDALPGVKVVSDPIRQYPGGVNFGNIIGYTGLLTSVTPQAAAEGYSLYDTVGKSGLEQYYETELRGTPGKAEVALDDKGQAIPGVVSQITAPVPGSSLHLSIDATEQAYAAKALAWGINASKLKMGVIIVMNPQNGEIKAMVSLPGYDNNSIHNISTADYGALINDPTGPTINKAVSEQYAPGSTYKLVTGTAGLQDGKITDKTIIQTVPYVKAGDPPQPYYDWNHLGFGPQNIYGGFAHSSDTFFYKLAVMLDPSKDASRLSYYAKAYGFGAPTGVDLPNEASGIVPNAQWKSVNVGGTPWYIGDTMHAGIGQGYDAVTPLQLLNAYCAMINGGKLWTPHIVTSITHPDGTVTPVPPTLLKNTENNMTGILPVSQHNLQVMRLASRQVVTSKHTYNLVDLPIPVAGKTGTAEFGVPDKAGVLPYHEWFVGYTVGNGQSDNFARTDSNLAVIAFVYGANTWGDVSTEIVKYYMWLHYHLRGSIFNIHNPGYIYSWITRRTNFYNLTLNH